MAKPVGDNNNTNTADFYVGAVLDIKGREVLLAPKTPINKIKEKGLELELPNNLNLGKAKDILNELLEYFGSKTKVENLTTEITVVDKLIKKAMDAQITIQDLYIHVPSEYKKNDQGKLIDKDGKVIISDSQVPVKLPDNDKKPTEYTVAIAATWPDEIVTGDGEKLPGSNFTLKGLYLMVTNEELTKIEARREQKRSLAASASSSQSSNQEPKVVAPVAETTTP